MWTRSPRPGPISPSDFIILGFNGETPSALGDDPRFNYTYVNYVGKSTYQGLSRHRSRKPRPGQPGDVST